MMLILLRLPFFILLLPHKEHRKADGQRYADQRNLNPAACFGRAIIEKPQLAAKLPLARPFPAKQQTREPHGKQKSRKEQTEFRVSLRPLEKRFSLSVLGLGHTGNAISG